MGKIARELLFFTIEFVRGIDELAKNAVQHSSFHRGVFTLRIYKGEKANRLIGASNLNANFYLDAHVIDDGEMGVVPNLMQNILDEDKVDEFRFTDLLNTTLGIKYNFQAKRATAHLGLLMFSKLIIENDGKIEASTWDIDGIREYSPLQPIDPLLYLPHMGTNYHISLPIKKINKLSPYVHHIIKMPDSSIWSERSNIENLFDFKEIILDDDNPNWEIEEVEIEKTTIVNVRFNLLHINYSNESQLWKEFMDFFLEPHLQLIRDRNAIICVDFNKVNLDESHLFRFIGMWELNFPLCPIIIYNIETELLFRLYKVNRSYIDQSGNKLPYWNKNAMTLIYSFHKTKFGDRFFYTDILFGETSAEFKWVNQIVNKNNFNTVSMLDIKSGKKGNDIPEEKMNMLVDKLNYSNFFYKSTSLIPYDLLIKDKNDITLFEYNAIALLKNLLLKIG